MKFQYILWRDNFYNMCWYTVVQTAYRVCKEWNRLICKEHRNAWTTVSKSTVCLVAWVWFECSWVYAYEILKGPFRPSSKSSCWYSCGHSWEMFEEIEWAPRVPLFSEASGYRQVELGSAGSISGRGKYCRKKYCILLLFETRKNRGIIPAMPSRTRSHVLFLAEYKLGFTKCKDCHTKPDHLPIILLPVEAIRERSTSLTHSQKLTE